MIKRLNNWALLNIKRIDCEKKTVISYTYYTIDFDNGRSFKRIIFNTIRLVKYFLCVVNLSQLPLLLRSALHLDSLPSDIKIDFHIAAQLMTPM